MAESSPPATREVLAGLVERVTFHNADNGFCVLRVKARAHRDLVTVVGHAAIISAGEPVASTAKEILVFFGSMTQFDRPFAALRVSAAAAAHNSKRTSSLIVARL
jgi:hypothetical protein